MTGNAIERNQAFWLAAEARDWAKAARLIAAGADVNFPAREGSPARYSKMSP